MLIFYCLTEHPETCTGLIENDAIRFLDVGKRRRSADSLGNKVFFAPLLPALDQHAFSTSQVSLRLKVLRVRREAEGRHRPLQQSIQQETWLEMT